jgi:uncharacterized protein YjbI with pentapeptide repeats
MEFDGDSFENKVFEDLRDITARLQDKEYIACTFKRCDFSNCDFTGSSFIDCVFEGCNLSNARVLRCGFQNASFVECKILGVSFEGVRSWLLSWKFKDCKLEMCVFKRLDMKRTRFIDCTIRETEFESVDMCESVFTGSDLTGSRFQQAVLKKADFSGALNYYIDPNQNTITQAIFSYPEVLNLLAGFQIKVKP